MEEPVRTPDGGLPVLIETFGWSPGGGFERLPAHLGRMRRAALALRLAWPEAGVAAALGAVGAAAAPGAVGGVAAPGAAGAAAGSGAVGGAVASGAVGGAVVPGAAGAAGRLRVRLTLGVEGARVETAPAPAGAGEWRVALAAERLRAGDPWLGVKSAWRPAHDAARAALAGRAEEAILLNERGEVCEGTITTVFVDRGDGVLLTPPLGCGVLPGVLRAELLAAGAAREAALRPGDLAAGLRVGNALRGLVRARLVEG